MSHEVQLNVYSPENIGYLIDNLLKYEDLTIKGIEWLPLDVRELSFRKKTQRRRRLSKGSNRVRIFASKSDFLWRKLSTLRR